MENRDRQFVFELTATPSASVLTATLLGDEEGGAEAGELWDTED